MKINIFNNGSPAYPYRWFIIFTIIITAFMAYHDITGRRLFDYSRQEEWSSSGPGYHK